MASNLLAMASNLEPSSFLLSMTYQLFNLITLQTGTTRLVLNVQCPSQRCQSLLPWSEELEVSFGHLKGKERQILQQSSTFGPLHSNEGHPGTSSNLKS